MKKIFIVVYFLFISFSIHSQAIVANAQDTNYEGGELRLMNSNSNYNPWNIDNYAGNLRFFHSGAVFLSISPEGNIVSNGIIKLKKASTTDNSSPGIVYSSNDDFPYDSEYINQYGFGFHGYQDGSSQFTNPTNTYISGHFGLDLFTGGINRLRISRDGLISIGTSQRQPGYLLAVNGKIRAKEIKVETGWSDFVFEKNYNLPTLEEVEKHIHDKGHLKDIPSAKEVEENGIFLGEMDAKLLQKIEELTLYTIQQEKRIQSLEEKNEKLVELVEKLINEKE